MDLENLQSEFYRVKLWCGCIRKMNKKTPITPGETRLVCLEHEDQTVVTSYKDYWEAACLSM